MKFLIDHYEDAKDELQGLLKSRMFVRTTLKSQCGWIWRHMTTLSQNFEELTLEVSCQEHEELEERFNVPEPKDKIH